MHLQRPLDSKSFEGLFLSEMLKQHTILMLFFVINYT